MQLTFLGNISSDGCFLQPLESLADMLNKIPADEEERQALVARVEARLKASDRIQIHLSQFVNYPELLGLAISKGADPAKTDEENRNAFFFFPNAKAIKLMAQHTSAVNQLDLIEMSAPQFLAARDYSDNDDTIEAVKTLIAFGAPYKNRFGGSTILHKLAHFDCVRQMELFVREGCDVNAKDEGELTPLHVATTLCNYPQIVRLIDLGAKIGGDLLLEWIEMLRNFSNEPSQDHLKNQKLLAAHIFRKCTLSDLRWSTLHFAVFTGNLEWIEEAYSKELDTPLACPCNAHETGREYTPLELALDNEASFFLLLEMGARPTTALIEYIAENPQYALQKNLIEIFENNWNQRFELALGLIKTKQPNRLRDLINKLSMRL